jgi:hypothetical protein
MSDYANQHTLKTKRQSVSRVFTIYILCSPRIPYPFTYDSHALTRTSNYPSNGGLILDILSKEELNFCLTQLCEN